MLPSNPSLLQKSPHITVRRRSDHSLSSSGHDLVSARAALALTRLGINKVWWLEWTQACGNRGSCLPHPWKHRTRGSASS